MLREFVSQTLNPKTGSWNKPKRGTYADFCGQMYLDELAEHCRQDERGQEGGAGIMCKCEHNFTCGECLRNAKPWHFTGDNERFYFSRENARRIKEDQDRSPVSR